MNGLYSLPVEGLKPLQGEPTLPLILDAIRDQVIQTARVATALEALLAIAIRAEKS